MKKRLLFAAFAALFVGSAFAYTSGDYVYSPTQRFKIQGENLVTNGDFSQARDGWYGATKEDKPDAATWDIVPDGGPNGEGCIKSLAATAGSPLCNSWTLPSGSGYVVMYDIKGETIGAIAATAGKANYCDFFVNEDGDFTKGSEGVTQVAVESYGFKDEWQKQVVYVPEGNADKQLVMHFEQLAAGVCVTNIEIYPVKEVFDIRVIERKLAYVDNLIATGVFTNDTEDGFVDNVVAAMHAYLDDPSLTAELDDITTGSQLVEAYDDQLNKWLDANSADLLAGVKRWSSYGDTRKQNSFAPWEGNGGRWFHKNNGGSTMITDNGDEIGHRLQGGMAAGAACQHYTMTPAQDGKVMFSIDIVGHYMAGTSNSWGNYVTDYNRDFRGVTVFIGPDTLWTDAAAIEASQNVKQDAGVISHPYAQTYTLLYDAKAGEPLTVGISYIPDPNHTAGKYGSNVNIANPQLRMIGITQQELDYKSEVNAIQVQQDVLTERIATAKEKAAQTKADGFPWGHVALDSAIVSSQAVLDYSLTILKDGEVLNEQAIRDSMTIEGATKVSNVVLAAVNGIKNTWQAFDKLNKSFTDLQAKVAEAREMLEANAGRGDATRRAALQTLADEADAIIAATGADEEKEAFDAKTQAITDAMASYKNSLVTYAEPSEQSIAANPETSSAAGWTFTENVSGKESFKKATQGKGWRAGYYTAVWRGNTASPQSKMVQTKTITDPGVYAFRANAEACNENFAYHKMMATIIEADEENNIVADTIYNQSEVKLFFGLNGAPDSVRVVSRQRLATGSQNSGAGSALDSYGYDANQYAIYYIKTGDEPVEVEFGLSSYGQVDKAGANSYGFGDTELLFYGEEQAFRTAMVADMTERINACQATLDESLKDEETAAKVATWTSRLSRRMVDAKAALGTTATVQDLTALANATYFVEETAAILKSELQRLADETGINPLTVAQEGTRAAKQGVYTLTGVRVQGNLQSLPRGLYIVNGKKVVVK